MKISLLLTGKTTESYIEEGVNVYQKRLKHYIGFEIIILPELKQIKVESLIKEKEAEIQLSKIGEGDYLILLDKSGKQFSSVGFAQYLQQLMNKSIRQVKFLVGGAYGFSPVIYQRANDKVALSEMTFSHQLVRLVFTEQLYRAFTIINNESYHH
ncbi:MAG: 23S rRNA (pseudouridine(1915)-N(3))-methyltransferase RlmH [Sphingobacteriales bacterium]|nr:MAG: 23S rRNA (pseudouridine(1915)-N(3))-methyltransferase RlmH [Sphingobacteriales bacterium]